MLVRQNNGICKLPPKLVNFTVILPEILEEIFALILKELLNDFTMKFYSIHMTFEVKAEKPPHLTLIFHEFLQQYLTRFIFHYYYFLRSGIPADISWMILFFGILPRVFQEFLHLFLSGLFKKFLPGFSKAHLQEFYQGNFSGIPVEGIWCDGC